MAPTNLIGFWVPPRTNARPLSFSLGGHFNFIYPFPHWLCAGQPISGPNGFDGADDQLAEVVEVEVLAELKLIR